ncbi:MAG TPA: AMP-binding protein, partial [Nannocystaceae bacterium]|nr:AMP-binding protein [Nannocystaceae bacterium]
MLASSFFALERFGERPAIVAPDGTLSWCELADAIAGYGLDVAPGERVALLGAPSLQLVVATLAVQYAGAIAVPLNPRHTAPELAHVLHDSGASRVLVDDTLRARVEPLARHIAALAPSHAGERAPPYPSADDDVALIIYTSGTTGPSKGVALPWRALASNMGALCRGWGFGPADVLSHALPLFHVHGLCIGIYGALLTGATILLHPRFDAAAIVADIRDRGATVFMGVPTMYVQLLEHLDRHPADAVPLSRARLFTAGSAALAPSVLVRFEELTGARILERYGMTETLITLSNPLHGERRAGTVGRPVDGVEIRIVDDELQVRGDSLMRGYWNNPSATAAAFVDGWFRTGDVAKQDPDGYVRILGRMSTDIVKSGGFKLSTAEIEEVLRDHPGVAEVAVIGVADAKWGERVVAVVVPRGGTPTREQLASHCRAALADYKTPR